VLQPCNPAVGGPAKSQLVHEVDALGGEIGKITDKYFSYHFNLIDRSIVERNLHE
jgi:tRNA U34 5-carboxymethylaminomethyl modifying enzyme MnmG/GidA